MNGGYSAARSAVSGGETRRRLRFQLTCEKVAVLAGAHDALSARLIEETGFDGVWASSFGMSLASRCMPDADLLTMSESLEIVRNMVLAVRVPVVADCNAGWGNAINVMRMVRDFEDAGVAGICIEDNPFPKRCSLYRDWERRLVSTEEMGGKVRAAKAAQRDRDFVVIARCEALIADEGVEAALERTNAYVEAGADAVLVHAREFAPLRSFVAQWCGAAPLVVVPTLFAHVSLDELQRLGFQLAILPNQAVRAATRAIRNVLEVMRAAGTGAAVDDDIASLEEVYELVDLASLREAERDFATAFEVSS